ncbi:OLC1v1021088C1 [Oldenlandia corymbosa var. corymbosa]|uniref:Hexosyltransferase n=1 Tax=Oldenlandia corymbosa var. corymbosa TaxID=529605 RepID=A0AAV1BXB9_OLDCO|nr:OLC1v1021088C1 [Oldenlandia corymbosa var. corymbosa]
MKLRKVAIVLLFMTVVAPIVLYTHTLSSYLSTSASSSENDFVAEEASTFTFGGEIRPLNLLPQEESINVVKEPSGVVYSYNSSSQTAADNARITRQLTEDSLEHQTKDLSSAHATAADENPIKQVVDYELPANQSGQDFKKPDLSGDALAVDAKEEITAKQHSLRNSGRTIRREQQLVVQTESQKEPALPDARVRQLKDQLIRGKVYLSLSATRNNAHFVRELRLRMKEVQRALGEASKDSELPRNAFDKLKAMELTLTKGKQIQDDCAAVIKKLRAMLHSTEEQLRVHKKQTLFLTHLTAKTLPKGLHCLPLRLSTEYFMLNASQQQFPNQDKVEDSSLYHYALFSDNVLAAAVVVNSTISHAKETSKHVFHIVTDRLNYAAMRMWFLENPPLNAAIEVKNVEEFTWLNSSYSPVLKQLGSPSMIDYYFKTRRGAESDSNLKFRNPKYLSIMNHLRFYLPQIFPKLDKVLFLDDDIVVQKDLSGLWSLNLKGKVIGVVETCGESFHRFDRYLNFSNPLISKKFDPRACGWAFGMNIVDLAQWRRQNITDVYHSWQNLNHDRQLWKLGTLPPGLITFWNHTYALDRFWHVLGLGYNPNVNQKDIDRAAVIHYNGNLKPWLEIGIPKYRNYWAKFVDYDQKYLRECNINP